MRRPNQITAHNAGWPPQFRFAVSVFWPGVCEFFRSVLCVADCGWGIGATAGDFFWPRISRIARIGRFYFLFFIRVIRVIRGYNHAGIEAWNHRTKHWRQPPKTLLVCPWALGCSRCGSAVPQLIV